MNKGTVVAKIGYVLNSKLLLRAADYIDIGMGGGPQCKAPGTPTSMGRLGEEY